jgi:imidazolonepropionase-like amidohydrolase
VKAIVGASVVKLDGSPSIQNAVVLIEEEKITAVGPASSTKVPPNAKVIRADGKWLVPGLMNMHVHLGIKLGAEGDALANETDAELALRMAANARKSLHAGVTTLRLVGEESHADFALRSAIERGDAEGPNIFTAGRSARVTGGHGSEVGETANDGPNEFRKAARQEIRAGANWIKILISGGIATRGSGIGASYMTREEIEAVTDIAHRHGVKVTAHSGSPEATIEAVDVGLDCVEHGYFLNEEALRKMKEKGTWLVPTIVVSRPATMPFFERIGSPPWYLARVKAAGEKHWNMLKTAVQVGARIGVGTDQLPFEPNDGTIATVREAEYYVEAGMTPVQALRAGTIETATLLGAEDRLGTIEAGKQADIIAVDQDPTKDISALRNIRFVMKAGKVVRNDIEPST